jgi:hypothetical protein
MAEFWTHFFKNIQIAALFATSGRETGAPAGPKKLSQQVSGKKHQVWVLPQYLSFLAC